MNGEESSCRKAKLSMKLNPRIPSGKEKICEEKTSISPHDLVLITTFSSDSLKKFGR
jgi:hypothetical protein